MYKELGSFFKDIAADHSIKKDGELWTALFLSIAAWAWFFHDPEVMQKIRDHVTDLLTVTSIIFGFVMTELVFYAEAAERWSQGKPVQKTAERIILWHVWTIFCMLLQICYMIILWLAPSFHLGAGWGAIKWAALVFLTAYTGLQILNHALSVLWAFKKRGTLMKGQGKPTDEP